MQTNVSVKEADEILKIFAQAIFDSKTLIEGVSDNNVKEALFRLLKKSEDEATKFFKKNMDGRGIRRGKPLIEDMQGYYRVHHYICFFSSLVRIRYVQVEHREPIFRLLLNASVNLNAVHVGPHYEHRITR